METNPLGQELLQCMNRAKLHPTKSFNFFDSVIQNQSMLINDGLFSNYKLIRQNQLTSMGYQIIMSLLQSFI